MTNMSTDLRDVIVSKVESVNTILASGDDDAFVACAYLLAGKINCR